MNKKGFSAVGIILVIVLVGLIGVVGYYVWSGNNTEEEISVTQRTRPVADESEQELETIENNYFKLIIPTGFSAAEERIFTFAGPPEETFSFINTENGDYFEININPAQSGVNADFTWYYDYQNGEFLIDKASSEVCMPQDDEWCSETGGNERLDAVILAKEQTDSLPNMYFTFGNIQTEEVGDLSFVDSFINNLSIK
jgi:hypothetical protein